MFNNMYHICLVICATQAEDRTCCRSLYKISLKIFLHIQSDYCPVKIGVHAISCEAVAKPFNK